MGRVQEDEGHLASVEASVNMNYSKLPDAEIIAGVELLSMKLPEARGFMADVTTAKYKLGRCKKQMPQPTWNCMMGVYTLRIENWKGLITEMKLLQQRLLLEMKSRGLHDD